MSVGEPGDKSMGDTTMGTRRSPTSAGAGRTKGSDCPGNVIVVPGVREMGGRLTSGISATKGPISDGGPGSSNGCPPILPRILPSLASSSKGGFPGVATTTVPTDDIPVPAGKWTVMFPPNRSKGLPPGPLTAEPWGSVTVVGVGKTIVKISGMFMALLGFDMIPQLFGSRLPNDF